MFVLPLLALVSCCVRFAASTPFGRFHRNGNQASVGTTAANWNLTSTASTSSSAVVAPTAPLLVTPSPIDRPLYPTSRNGRPPILETGTGFTRPATTAQGLPHSLPSSNHSGAPCTVNIPHANIDWWYAATYRWPVGALFRAQGNFTDLEARLSNIPNTATFDVTRALSAPAYTDTESYDAQYDITWTYPQEYTVKPSATITSVVSRTAYSPLPSGNVILAKDVYLYSSNIFDLPPATLAVAGYNRTAFVATSATPVAYFSVYEVEATRTVTANDGQVTSTKITETFNLREPYAYPYQGKGIEDAAVAYAAVPSAFLRQIPQASCAAGTLTATVTVLVIVDLYYNLMVYADPFRVHVESTALGFEDPTATTDPLIYIKDSGRPTFDFPRIEQTVDGFIRSSTSPKPGKLHTDSPGPEGEGSPGQGPAAPEPTQHTVGSIGTVPVVIGPSSVVVVGSQTLTKGAPPVTIGRKPVSLVPSGNAVVVGGTRTSLLPSVLVRNSPQPRPPIITIGSSTLTPNAATQFFLEPGQTLSPGGVATVDGTVISLAPSASFIVIGGSTQALPTAPLVAVTAKPTVVVGGSTLTQNSDSRFIIGTQTLEIGKPITVDSTVLSLGSNFVVVNQATSTFADPAIVARPEITLASSTVTANEDGKFVINGQTLALNSQAITVNGGTTVSLAASNVVVVNGISSTFANPAAQITPPPLTISNGIFRALPGAGITYLIGSMRLTPGGVVTVAGTTISLAPAGTVLVVNGVTTTLSPYAPTTNPPIFTVGLETFSAFLGTTYLVHGQTLTPGGIITFDGTTVSLAPGATELVYRSFGDSTTTALFPATRTQKLPVTRTEEPSAGATRADGGPAETSSTGAGHGVRPSKFTSWIHSMIIGLLAFVLS